MTLAYGPNAANVGQKQKTPAARGGPGFASLDDAQGLYCARRASEVAAFSSAASPSSSAQVPPCGAPARSRRRERSGPPVPATGAGPAASPGDRSPSIPPGQQRQGFRRKSRPSSPAWHERLRQPGCELLPSRDSVASHRSLRPERHSSLASASAAARDFFASSKAFWASAFGRLSVREAERRAAWAWAMRSRTTEPEKTAARSRVHPAARGGSADGRAMRARTRRAARPPTPLQGAPGHRESGSMRPRRSTR